MFFLVSIFSSELLDGRQILQGRRAAAEVPKAGVPAQGRGLRVGGRRGLPSVIGLEVGGGVGPGQRIGSGVGT